MTEALAVVILSRREGGGGGGEGGRGRGGREGGREGRQRGKKRGERGGGGGKSARIPRQISIILRSSHNTTPSQQYQFVVQQQCYYEAAVHMLVHRAHDSIYIGTDTVMSLSTYMYKQRCTKRTKQRMV